MKRLLYFLETNSLLVLLLEKWLHDRGHHFEDRSGVVEDEGLDSLGIAILQRSHAEKTINIPSSLQCIRYRMQSHVIRSGIA